MLPKTHFLFGLVGFVVLYFGFDVSFLGCFVFLVASVGIDVDHYLYYGNQKGSWNLRKAIDWFIGKRKVLRSMDSKSRRGVYTALCFLHGIEILVLLGLAGYFVWGIFYFVALGFLFHLIFDYIDQILWRARFDKVSVVYDYFRHKKLKFVEEIEETSVTNSKAR